MDYRKTFISPAGELLLASDGVYLTGLWFVGARYFAAGLKANAPERELPVFDCTAVWLDSYFAGEIPECLPPLRPTGTLFQQRVWQRLLEIPYGTTVTYGTLAKELSTSPRAVGNAVGHNPISLLIPCHRVVGADGSLTGFAGGMDKKALLLHMEGIL